MLITTCTQCGARFRVHRWNDALAGPQGLGENSRDEVIQRTDGYGVSILAQYRASAIEDEYNVQYNVVITRVYMVLVGVPIAATNVELDITCDTFCCRTGMSGGKL